MAEPLRVLLVEDAEDDALLMLRELRKAGYEPMHERVDSEQALSAALERQTWNLVLADYALPSFDGLRAFEIAARHDPHLPFFIVSGRIGEERAVEAMKRGVSDYIPKDKLPRLGPAVARELQNAETRRMQQKVVTMLQESEERFRAIIENTQDVISILDANGAFKMVSPSVRAQLGYAPEEMVGRSAVDYVHPEDQPRVRTTLADSLLAPGKTDRIEFRYRHKNGSWRHIELIGTNLSDTPAIGGLLGLLRDITARKRAEERLAAIIENSLDVITVLDADFRFRQVSPSVSARLGYTPDELLGRNAFTFVHPEDLTQVEKELAAVFREPDAVGAAEFRFRHQDGSWRHFELLGKNLLENPAVQGLLGTLRDTSERKGLEAQLLQAQRMEAVGRLAGGIAHDFNNMLAVISSYSGFVMDLLEPDHPAREDLQVVLDSVERGAALTRQLLTFSRRQVMQLKTIDLNGVVAGMEKILGRTIGEDIRLRTNLAPDLGPVRADENQIEQIIMNLAVNARDAMPTGGMLTIETANKRLDEHYAIAHHDVPPGAYVMLAVTDTGVGMDEQIRRQIFEPFFTTKEAGKGTGLGLATVYGIVRQMRGQIFVYSEPGRGTSFKIYFPLAGEKDSQEMRASPAAVDAGGSETILLAEDDDQVRSAARRILESAGYAVIAAENGERAIAAAQAHRGRVDLLLTDVVMPGMSGSELLASAQRLGVPRVLFVSGYTDDTIVNHGILEGDYPFLHKPFTRQALLEKVRETLNRPGTWTAGDDPGATD